MDADTEELEAQVEWYADQALENEAAARRLEQVCEKTLTLLDDFGTQDSFEKAYDRLAKAKVLLRERHRK